VEAHDFTDFGNALKRKLLLEFIASGDGGQRAKKT
jgi:hypothetical protein